MNLSMQKYLLPHIKALNPPPQDLGWCHAALAPPFGSMPPPGSQSSFYSLIHTPRIDLCRPGHPACRHQLSTAFTSSLLSRWPTWTQKWGLGVPDLYCGMIGVGKYWAVRGHWQRQARWTKWWCCVMVRGWADTWLGWQMGKNWSTVHCGTVGRWGPGVMMMRCVQLPAASLKNWTAQRASSKDPTNNVKVKEWPGINQVNYSASC